MAIVEKTISDSILAFLNKNTIEEDLEKAKKAFADDLAKVVVDAIKSAEVKAGIPVSTTGGSGSTTGTGTLF